MQSVANKLGEEIWPRIAPLLDSAVANLSESDREAIVLRYYEGKTLREVGAALSASEDAAEKRVARALDKLRAFFVKRGITVGATGLAAIITANAVHAAPEGLAATVSTAALVGTPVAAASIITTTTKAIAMTILQKQLTATIVAALLVCAITTYVATRDSAPKARGNSALAGKWQTEDKTETMDFLSDGTCQGNDYRRQ